MPKVSHEELDAAAEKAAAEEKAAEEAAASEAAESETPEEKAEREAQEAQELLEQEEKEKLEKHKDDSALGRKVAAQGEQISQLVTSIEILVQGMAKPVVEKEQLLDQDEFITRRQAIAEFQRMESEKSEVQRTYETTYLNALAEIGKSESNKEKHQAILDEMDANFRHQIYGHAGADAKENYLSAKIALLEQGVTEKKNPLTGKAKPVGGPAGDSEKDKAITMPKLDEHAAAFAAHHKLKPEDVAKTLSGETPLSLRGKV